MKVKCAHPKGLKQRFREAQDIDVAMSVLLEASHEEAKLRAKVRAASTLEGALNELFEIEQGSDDEQANELNLEDFGDAQLFILSGGDSEWGSNRAKLRGRDGDRGQRAQRRPPGQNKC